ncbi:universal stress protein [Methylobacterium oxalidis]
MTTVRPDGTVDSGTALAISLAERHDALLTALIYEAGASSPTEAAPLSITQADSHTAGHEAEFASAAVRAAAGRAGIRHEVVLERISPFNGGETFASYARVRDLAVLGVSGVLQGEARLLAQTLLFGSGRPVILVPQGTSSVPSRRILIAWDATPGSVHAVVGAMPLLREAAEIVVVTVVDDKPFHQGQSGVELCRHLERHGNEAVFEAVERKERPVGNALLQAADRHSADLLVMGGYAHSSLRGLIFGSATREVLETPLPLPVLLAH